MQTENKTTELKREYVDDIKNTVVAFANCDGGTIYIGINDDGSIRGVDDADETMLRVTNAIRDAVRPDVTMFVDCGGEDIDGKQVVRVTVRRGTARPYYLRGKGIRPEGVYVRQGASTVPASETAILDMIKETGGDSYEAARSLIQQLTFDKAAEFFKRRGVSFGAAQMRTLRMIGEDGMYTNLAFLLSDQCAHSLKMAVFEGGRKSVFKDRLELSGSLLAQLDGAYEFIDRFNRTRAEFDGLDRIDRRDYPPEAVREALLNALVHRDYSFSAPTLISVFDDRIEFVSVGGLVKGLSMDDLRLGVSILRNPNLANIFYRLRLIEAYGTGMLKINECYEDALQKPKIEASSHAFKVTLPNVNFGAESVVEKVPVHRERAKEERVRVIEELCRENGYVTRKDLEKAFEISQATAVLLLRKLTGDGLLLKEGSGSNVRYYINSGASK